MSAQTGTPSFVPYPPSSRTVDLARARLSQVRNNPNPIWIRELRQAARLKRTPVILMTVTALLALLMSAIGGIMSVTASPATTGITLFHTFFSLAFFVVTLVGPALAANSVASEREGHTWEAVILTGLPPKTIARGKFLSAYAAICMYIVMMAPVGSLPFLFGGVTVLEVLVAFFFLFLFALLSVAFGLAISSALASGRVAILLTLLLAFIITLTSYIFFGVALSFAANEAWPSVLGGPPVWLPTAYERAPFSLSYFVFLVLIPVVSILVPAWLFYEVTIANLTSPTCDRATGLKRWFAVMTVLLTSASLVPVLALPTRALDSFWVAILVLSCFFLFAVFLFQGDAIGPSRKVIVHWDRRNAGKFTRFFGPGLMKTMTLVFVVGSAAMLLLGGMGVLANLLSHGVSSKLDDTMRIAAVTVFLVAYFLFLAGGAAWLRARSATPGIARVLLMVAIFLSAAGPWIFAAIGGIVSDGNREALVMASPSPFYLIVLVEDIGSLHGPLAISAVAISTLAWSMLGFGLFLAAHSRATNIIEKYHKALAETDELLAKEDEQARVEAENQSSSSQQEAVPT